MGEKPLWRQDRRLSPLRILTAIDVRSRECLLLEASKSFSGAAVALHLTDVAEARGARPERILVDNGTEFTSNALPAPLATTP